MMKFVIAAILYAACAVAVWPAPSSLTTGSAVFYINAATNVTYTRPGAKSSFVLNSAGSPPKGAPFAQTVVQTAIGRTYTTLFTQNFVPWKFHPRNSDFEPSPSASKKYITSISLTQNSTDPKTIANPADGDVNESYTLTISAAGAVAITAASSIGVAHALTTLTQLFYAHSAGGVYTALAPVQISDAPQFPHRGLNLDIARSWYPVPSILHTIDALAYNKFNRLHLHASDSQSWPVEIPALPNLAAKGAYRSSLTYSPSQIQNIQEYGAVRGVSVYLEFDMPGHTTAIGYGYPDLIAAQNVQPNWGSYAAEPPSGTLKLNSTAVYTFLSSLWKDILPRLAPYTAYMHTGGDEVNFNAYTLDPTVRSSNPAVLRPLLQKLTNTNHAAIRAAGLTPLVWEESVLNYNLTLGADVVVQAWTSDSSVAAVTALGHKVIASNYNYWYLDCGMGQWLDFAPGAAAANFFPYADYCSPRKNWRLMYAYDPLAGVPAAQQHLVLGGEVCMWGEQTDPVNVQRNVWPRACAAGEILWSGPRTPSGQNRSQIEASPRLSEMRERLVARGIMAEPIRMPFCTMVAEGEADQCAIFS